MSANTNPPDESQAQSGKSTNNKKPRRRLDHMRDLADGVDQFDMVPRKLSRAYIDGKFPESKYRLLLCMMSHSDGFHVKREYLEKRFGQSTLVKYLKELQVEGYIAVESLVMPTGGTMKLYHVRSLEHWDLYRHPVDPPVNGGPVNGGPVSRGLKDPKCKKESKETKPSDDEGSRGSEEKPSSSFVRDHSSLITEKPENLRPSDYVNLIGPKIKSAKIKGGKVVWIPKIGVANKAAAAFIQDHGIEMMDVVCSFILERGHVSVCETMFHDVLPYMDGSP